MDAVLAGADHRGMSISLQRPRVLPPRVVVYGPPKVGKSTFAAGAPSPVFLPLEDGLGTLDVPILAGESGKIASWPEFGEALQIVGDMPDVRTVVIDSVTAAQDLLFGQIAREAGVKSIADIDYGKGYPRALPRWLGMLGTLDALRASGKAIVLIGHSQVEPYANPEGETYDRHTLRLHQQAEGKPSLRAAVLEWADVLGFATLRTFASKVGKGFDERVIAKGAGERVLYTTPAPARVAGSRYALPDELPLEWSAFIGAYKAAVASARKPSTPVPSVQETEPEPERADQAEGSDEA